VFSGGITTEKVVRNREDVFGGMKGTGEEGGDVVRGAEFLVQRRRDAAVLPTS
jgi:hypothetical protein